MKINFTKTVWIVSLISFFTDIASEMLYPILPIYLEAIGFSVFYIGILEGIAEAVASLSKGYFGKLSDVTGRRVIFVRLGYTLSAFSKPLMGIFTQAIPIFLARTTDRLGKGIRTGARDAILSLEATKENKFAVFGFHRSMDTLGAVLGPLIALAYLHYFPSKYQTLFLIAFIPGLFAILLTFLLVDKYKSKTISLEKSRNFFSFLNYWKQSPKKYKVIIIGFLSFALINSSDTFLLLKMKHSGLNDVQVIGTYVFYNLIYASFGLPLGVLTDKLGARKTYILGLALFASVYLGMSLNVSLWGYFALFFFYGIYAAATEGISKAWIANVVPSNEVATAIGFYSSFQGILNMVSSSLAGWVWFQFGANTLFLTTGLICVLIIFYFVLLKEG